MNSFHSRWITELKHHGIDLSNRQLTQFQIYYKQLIEWNKRMNLTAITEEQQVYYKHFFDSLSLSFFLSLEGELSLADIGSGAGFPGIPLAILNPNVKVTIIDALNKRIRFLEHLIDQLQCANVRCIHGRAEDIGQDNTFRETFDIVTARAVARLQILNEFCLPLVKVGGVFVAMKAADADTEVNEAKNSLHILGGKISTINQFQLPYEQASRKIIIISKTRSTPKKYPRKSGVPAKQPL